MAGGPLCLQRRSCSALISSQHNHLIPQCCSSPSVKTVSGIVSVGMLPLVSSSSTPLKGSPSYNSHGRNRSSRRCHRELGDGSGSWGWGKNVLPLCRLWRAAAACHLFKTPKNIYIPYGFTMKP